MAGPWTIKAKQLTAIIHTFCNISFWSSLSLFFFAFSVSCLFFSICLINIFSSFLTSFSALHHQSYNRTIGNLTKGIVCIKHTHKILTFQQHFSVRCSPLTIGYLPHLELYQSFLKLWSNLAGDLDGPLTFQGHWSMLTKIKFIKIRFIEQTSKRPKMPQLWSFEIIEETCSNGTAQLNPGKEQQNC